VNRGVVFAEPGARPAVEEIMLDPPGEHEVQVRVEACGVCHTDLHVVETDGWGMKFPILLGHEGAGVVEEVGEGVTGVAPGDRIVVAYVASGSEGEKEKRKVWAEVRLLDVASGKQRVLARTSTPAELPGIGANYTLLGFTADGKQVVVTSSDPGGTIKKHFLDVADPK